MRASLPSDVPPVTGRRFPRPPARVGRGQSVRIPTEEARFMAQQAIVRTRPPAPARPRKTPAPTAAAAKRTATQEATRVRSTASGQARRVKSTAADQGKVVARTANQDVRELAGT